MSLQSAALLMCGPSLVDEDCPCPCHNSSIGCYHIQLMVTKSQESLVGECVFLDHRDCDLFLMVAVVSLRVVWFVV